MQVKDTHEFLADIDEYEVDRMRAVESEKINDIVAVKVYLKKPISGEQELVSVNAYPRKEKGMSDLGLRAAGTEDALSYEPKKWYQLEFRADEQECSGEAIGAFLNRVYDNQIDFRDVLDKSYTLDVKW